MWMLRIRHHPIPGTPDADRMGHTQRGHSMSPLSLSALALGSRTAQPTGERATSEKSKYEGTDGPWPCGVESAQWPAARADGYTVNF